MRMSVLGAPVSAGAYAPGQEKAPAALRGAGLVRALEDAGLRPTDLGDIDHFRWRLDAQRPQGMHPDVVARAAAQVAKQLAPVLADDGAAFVIGGDCTVEIGTVAAAAAAGGDFGLIYIDLDADLNTPASTSDGAFDWMGVAHMLGIEGTDPTLTSGLGPVPLLDPRQLLYFATANVRPFEREIIDRLGIAEIPLAQVAADPKGAAAQAVRWARGFDRLLVHLDADVLDYAKFPLAENTRRGVGLDYAQLIASLAPLLQAPNWRVLTLTEINPDHCSDPKADLERVALDLAAILASSHLQTAR
ncbi:MAG TPA: arginase family protein [Sphingomicrobium sp.]|nr:arginase family protein [Sphingomicrobium sp.]